MATITVKYEELKSRMDRAFRNGNADYIARANHNERKRAYSTIVQVLLGVTDYNNVNPSDVRKIIRKALSDFHPDHYNGDDKYSKLLNNMLDKIKKLVNDSEIKNYSGHTLDYVKRPESQTQGQNANTNTNQNRTTGGNAGANTNQNTNTNTNRNRTAGGNAGANPNPNTNRFNFQAYLQSVKKLAPWALGGAVVGLGASIIIPSAALSGAGTIRLVYSVAKFTNKIISKKFLNGQPTPVDKVITNAKDAIKNKYGSTKIYKGIEKINEFLKKPETQWFINGMAVGYKIGNWLDLNGKVKSLFETKNSTSTTVPNETANLQTEATDPTVGESTVPQENIPQETIPQENISTQKPARPIQKPRPEIEMDAPTTTPTPETTDYSWLDVGKDGDKIDLSGMKQGYTDSYAARGAYTGQYEHLNKAVNLASKYATEANGTFISELRLPDGSIFTGNIGDLLKTGIDPSKIAARIANQNGDYAWGNLEDVLETLSKASSRSR